MAAQAVWQPKEEGLREICGLLRQHIRPTSDQSRILQQLQHYSQFPDFNNYLAFIFTSAEGESVEIRQAAGLLLKNNLKTSFNSLDSSCQTYIKTEILPCLGASDRNIKSTVGTVISVIVEQGRISTWPELLGALLQCLDSDNLNHMEGAMDAISKICEDIPEELVANFPGLGERPINVLLPRLFQLFESPHASLRKLSLQSIKQFIMLMPAALYSSMDRFLQCLLVLSRDSAAEVRKLVCAAFVELVEVQTAFLEPHLRSIAEFMLQANKDSDDEVALEACEFWSTYCDSQANLDLLREFLQHLIPVLLTNMAYADDDEALAEAEEDDSLPDREQNIKPHFHSSRFHGSDDDKNDDDDSFNIWNLRKCSAASLDTISNYYGDDILPILMPLVQAKLSTSTDETWKEREAAVLAIGAIAEGSIEGLYPHLLEIVEFLIPLLDDKFPLIRSITCWTLSRFSRFIIQGIGNQKGLDQFNKVLAGLLRRILDSNKRVQEAACSALATLEEEAADELVPHLEIILQHLLSAFERYQKRNLRIVYDAIAALADAVGAELNQPRYIDTLIPPLISKWQQLSNSDKELFPLLECFSSIAQALGTGFCQFAQPVFVRCMIIIQSQLLAKVDPVSAGVQHDSGFMVCALDLLSGLVEGLGSMIEALVTNSLLRDLLLQCCMDHDSDVRQSAFALLGDLARVCPAYLHPRLSEFINLAAKQLETPQVSASALVANNACWAIGEMAVKVKHEISSIVMTLMSCLVPILQHAQNCNRSLVENAAITLGRLSWVCPEIVSPHLEHFIQFWCITLSRIRDDIEKEDAFRGLCAIVRLNPSGALSSLMYICKSIASWNVIRSQDLHDQVSQLLNMFKQTLRAQDWELCLSMLEPPERHKLTNYGI
ncbi:transportin-1-like isoform X2 [Punica granatum]|uniref:Transportin-1 n=2 Tax=Punica granatum TaxID=22663 RepID=A0A218X7K2_PUNGR|nr:transportin-1-like isoform X2 [Punica granatum]OWM80947.1 hypothetical protein CDL15_Pgr006978 [Punica granatum]PKI45623.1 hypothetical protein CRG98_033939 [Punica granatum]